MIKSFLVSMFAIFLFTLGAAGAWFYIQMSPGDEADQEGSIDLAGQVMDEPDPIPQLERGSESGSLPAIVRGPELNPEEVVRLNMAAAARQEQLRQHEETLRELRLRIETSKADAKVAQREIEGVLGQSANLLDTAENLLKEIQAAVEGMKRQSQELQQRKDEMTALEAEMGAGAAANIKTFASYMEIMPPDTAAETLKEMITDGKMEYVVQLLKEMEARNVSKILAEFNDSPMVAEIAARYSAAKYR